MKVLLDTHTALWMVNEYEKLSPSAKALLLNEDNALFISIASLWEIAIKVSIGKLSELDGGVNVLLSNMERMPIEILSVTTDHIRIVESLPFIHRDPFDRMLIATAISNDMTILTADSNIPEYNVSCIW